MEDEKAGVAEAGMAGQPEHICQLARLIEAGGRPELDLALVGCAGGRVCRGLWAAAFHLAGQLEVGQPDVAVAVTVEDVEGLRRVAGLLGWPDRPAHRPSLARALALLDDAEVDATTPGLVVVG